jgi:large subunit ribosomal protein L23
MVTLYRPPTKTEPSGPELEPYQVVVRPLITEKATHLSERHNAYTFEVNPLATKTQIKDAIESLFNVKVLHVRTQNRRGKARRYRLKVGRMRNWKKAIVSLQEEYRIDFY